MTRRHVDRVVVVGASVAGVSAAEAVRETGFEGEVVLLGAERHLPYDRPPLSKQLLSGAWSADQIGLLPKVRYAELDIDLQLGAIATGVDVTARTLRLEAGGSLTFDGLIVATGAHPRLPPFMRRLEGVHLLRTLDDSLALRSALLGRPRVAMIGAGFIGSEVAATARSMGCEVTVLEALSSPMVQAVGLTVGKRLARLHAERGVAVLCNARVAALVGDHVVQAVLLEDGRRIAADLVVIGTGVAPATGWLQGSGVIISDGLVCDENCCAGPNVYTAGDVARWTSASRAQMRVEHWTNAVEQGRYAGLNLIASLRGEEQKTYAPTHYFWSEQYRHKVQFVGSSSSLAEVLPSENGQLVVLYAREGALTGALTLDGPRLIAMLRRLVTLGAPIEEARAAVAVASSAASADPSRYIAGADGIG